MMEYDTITATITRLDIYSDDSPSPIDSILFTEEAEARAVRFDLLDDDGLQGIARIEVVTGIATNERAVDEFYGRVANA
jgi:hypothetical protein